jgi:hypothetical protein
MSDRRRTLIMAAIVFAATMAIYGAMLPANVGVGDEAEAQTVPYILGIAHPTGFPAYTLAGWAFSHALPFGTVAWRLNAFVAVCTALSTAGVFLLAVAIGSGAYAAAFAAFAFAFGNAVWYGALHANAQVLAATCSVFALLACTAFARSGDPRALFAACACCGLGTATHPAAIWIVPAIAVALLWRRNDVTAKTLAVAVAALVLPLLLYGYLPLRSAVVAAGGLDPNAAAPLYGTGNFDWDTNAPRTYTGFLDEVLGRREGAGPSFLHAFDPRGYPGAAQFWFTRSTLQYRTLLLALAAIGAVALARADRRSLSVLAAGTLGGIAFSYAYRTDTHIDRYEIVSYAVTAALAAACTRLTLPRLSAASMAAYGAAVLAVVAGLAVIENEPRVGPLPSENGERIIDAVRNGTPDRSIVVAQWNDAAALGYGAFVERTLGSRLIVSGWPSQYGDLYEGWAAMRPVIVYVSPLAARRIWPLAAPVQPIRGPRRYHVYQVVPPSPPARSR